MRRPSPLLARETNADLDSAMTPMIDVVFLLLVFFVWTASFVVVEHILPTEMTAQLGSDPIDNVEPPPERDFDDVVVRIGWNGTAPSWSMNQQPLESLQALAAKLTAIAAIQSDSPVILHPDSVVPLGHVIEAYDVARTSGFNQVSFAVNPQDQP